MVGIINILEGQINNEMIHKNKILKIKKKTRNTIIFKYTNLIVPYNYKTTEGLYRALAHEIYSVFARLCMFYLLSF